MFSQSLCFYCPRGMGSVCFRSPEGAYPLCKTIGQTEHHLGAPGAELTAFVWHSPPGLQGWLGPNVNMSQDWDQMTDPCKSLGLEIWGLKQQWVQWPGWGRAVGGWWVNCLIRGHCFPPSHPTSSKGLTELKKEQRVQKPFPCIIFIKTVTAG